MTMRDAARLLTRMRIRDIFPERPKINNPEARLVSNFAVGADDQKTLVDFSRLFIN